MLFPLKEQLLKIQARKLLKGAMRQWVCGVLLMLTVASCNALTFNVDPAKVSSLPLIPFSPIFAAPHAHEFLETLSPVRFEAACEFLSMSAEPAQLVVKVAYRVQELMYGHVCMRACRVWSDSVHFLTRVMLDLRAHWHWDGRKSACLTTSTAAQK